MISDLEAKGVSNLTVVCSLSLGLGMRYRSSIGANNTLLPISSITPIHHLNGGFHWHQQTYHAILLLHNILYQSLQPRHLNLPSSPTALCNNVENLHIASIGFLIWCSPSSSAMQKHSARRLVWYRLKSMDRLLVDHVYVSISIDMEGLLESRFNN